MPKLKSDAKVAIVTALISSIGTILIAFIGIVPTLRQSDQTKIAGSQKEIEKLQSTIGDLQKSLDEIYTISGRVRSTDNSPLSGTELYAAKADDSSTLDDNGRFLFHNVLRRPYRVIVVDQQTGRVRRLLIDPDDSPPENETAGIAISYNFEKK